MKGPVDIHVREQNRHNQHSAPQVEVDFSEYVWMGEELEEFDRKVNFLFLKLEEKSFAFKRNCWLFFSVMDAEL